MAEIGSPLDSDTLVLTRGRDFQWTFQNLDENGQPIDFPVGGELFFEFNSQSIDNWDFVIDGDVATIKIESTVADTVPARTKWQLVWLPSGEAAGGDAVALGSVQVQGA
jgi:hypothetical protein